MRELYDWAWENIPYEDDPRAQLAVAAHPDGLTCRQIAAIMGLGVDEVERIEQRGLEVLRNVGSCPEQGSEPRADPDVWTDDLW